MEYEDNMATTYEKISTTTLGSTASSITLSSIPATYTDIEVVFIGTISVNGAEIGLRFNGSSSSYSATRLRVNLSGTPSSVRDTSYTYIPLTVNPPNTLPSFCKATVFSYAGSTNKTVLETGSENRGGGSGEFGAIGVGLWQDTAAITSITIMNNSGGTFSVGSILTLYGIKAA